LTRLNDALVHESAVYARAEIEKHLNGPAFSRASMIALMAFSPTF
jgi:hypothetical protein